MEGLVTNSIHYEAETHCLLSENKAETHCLLSENNGETHCLLSENKGETHCLLSKNKGETHCLLSENKGETHCPLSENKGETHCLLSENNGETHCLLSENKAETHCLLYENQAGFRNGCCTEDQLLRLTQSIGDGFQHSPMKRTVLTLIDYSRAHDRVWRDALLRKMLWKGVSSHLIRWIQAWLANRLSRVAFDGAKSMKTILKQGVPQSPVLSPPLFLFYIDDLRWGSGDLHISLFVDNVAIWTQDSKVLNAEKRLQQGLVPVTTTGSGHSDYNRVWSWWLQQGLVTVTTTGSGHGDYNRVWSRWLQQGLVTVTTTGSGHGDYNRVWSRLLQQGLVTVTTTGSGHSDYNRVWSRWLHGVRTGRYCSQPKSQSVASSHRTRMNQNGNQLSV